MAAGFKQATVNASSVPATQTNFPSYVDLSRLGITTLAEAQSVRCYSDASKTTELAREIVSVTEMHVKIPSLTSTFVIYVDWDGVSADYAVTATYGRNAVWSDYAAVYHLEEDPSGSAPQIIDSTGNYDGTSGGSMTSGDSVTGVLGKGIQTDGTNDYIDLNDAGGLQSGTGDYYFSTIIKFDSLGSGSDPFFGGYATTNDSNQFFVPNGQTKIQSFFRDGSAYRTRYIDTSLSTGTWYHFACNWDISANTINNYLNGSLNQAAGYADSAGTVTNIAPALDYVIGGRNYNGTADIFSASTQDEIRIRKEIVSANWITTEYNNQSAESTFWGTWTDVGGGGGSTFIPKVIFMN